MTSTNPKKSPRWWHIPVLIGALLVCTLVASGVAAYWTAGTGGTGSGAASALTVGAGNTPTATASGTSVAVGWTASTLSSGAAVNGYQVKRYNASTGAVQTIGAGCSGTITALTCTESTVPNGQWQYTVTPLYSTNWTGAQSGKSAVVTTNSALPVNAITLSNVTGAAVPNGTTVYYNGSSAGSFTLTNAVTDTGSGPASSSTAALGGTSTGWTATPSTVSTPTGGPYVSTAFSWTAGTTSSPTEVVTGRDVANNSAATTLSFVNDSTSPTGSISYTNGYQVGKYVTVTFSGSDAGAGLATGSSQLQRASARFVNGACLTFTAFSNIGSANPTSPYTDNSVSNATCYQYRYLLTDLVGNTATITSPNTAWVDYAGAVRFETTGIVSQLRFGDSSANGNVTAADSVGSLNPTYVNGPVLGVSGDLPNDSDTAVSLDGNNDYIQDTSPTGLPAGTSSRSIELWFKTSSQLHQTLFTYGSFANNGEFGLWINPGGTGFTAWGWGGGNDPVFNTASSVEDGKWHQVVETYNGSGITLYVDGASLGTQATTRSTTVDGYGLQIGDVVEPNDANSGFNFNGSLDEFSIYNVALSQTDVTNHYQLGANTGADSVGPTGGSVAATGLGGTGSLYSTSTSLNLALATGTDASGVATTGAYLFRATATLTSTGNADGVCGSFGAYSLVATDPSTPYTDVVGDQACYVYRYAVPDTLGNYSTYSSGLIKVDTRAPSGPTLTFTTMTNAYFSGGTLYFKAGSSGKFTVTAASTDTTSGVTGYTFPAGASLGTGWSSTGTGASRVYSFTAAAVTPAGISISAANNAGSSSSATLAFDRDATAPSGVTIAPPSGNVTSTSVTIAFSSGTDSESGIGTTTILYQSATVNGAGNCKAFPGTWSTLVTNPGGSSYTYTASATHCYEYEITVSDNVGNTTTVASANVLHIA